MFAALVIWHFLKGTMALLCLMCDDVVLLLNISLIKCGSAYSTVAFSFHVKCTLFHFVMHVGFRVCISAFSC